jgi:cyclase
MKIFFYFSTFCLFLIIFCSPEKANSQGEDLKMQKLSENLYVLSGGGGNVAFLVTENGVLVVDSKVSPALGEKVISKIREVTDKSIIYLIYTHYHGDHIQGAQNFPKDITVVSHINTLSNIEKISLARLTEQKIKLLPKQQQDLEEKVKIMQKEKNAKLAESEKELETLKKRINDIEHIKIIKPNFTVGNEAAIYMGTQVIKLFYLGSAHTNGELIVHFVNEKIIHTGDLLFNNIIPYIDFEAGCNTENWISILEKLSKMDVVKFIPGHGEVTDKGALSKAAEYFKDIRAEVKKYISQGKTLDETKNQLTLEKYKDLDGYKQRLSRNVEAIYQEMKNAK